MGKSEQSAQDVQLIKNAGVFHSSLETAASFMFFVHRRPGSASVNELKQLRLVV